MTKAPFTTRIDEDIRALAEKVAESERRSLTSLIEVALLEYCKKRGYALLTKMV
jgi:hypothetical protein